jgi:hypothetical protein
MGRLIGEVSTMDEIDLGERVRIKACRFGESWPNAKEQELNSI